MFFAGVCPKEPNEVAEGFAGVCSDFWKRFPAGFDVSSAWFPNKFVLAEFCSWVPEMASVAFAGVADAFPNKSFVGFAGVFPRFPNRLVLAGAGDEVDGWPPKRFVVVVAGVDCCPENRLLAGVAGFCS